MNNFSPIKRFSVVALTTAAVLLHCSCREKGEVQHFRTPKADTAKTTDTAANPTDTPATQPAKAAPYTWTLPTGWTDKPASGMRLATILIPSPSGTLNASITEFGGDLAGNVNRWRGQIGLPPLQESAIPATVKEVETGLGKGYIVSLVNPETPDSALLAAVIPRPTDTSVFIKIPGKSTELDNISEAFTAFTQSLSPSQK